ncbi:hypothetical protein EBU94_02130 [bacterium]|nr:hypothetical protein [bacterium]
MNTELSKSIHAINLNHKEISPLREWYYSFIFKITNGRATTIFHLFPRSWRNFYYDHIRTIFKPHHKRLRKAIPRQWSDISHLIVMVNFEFIKSFYEDEYVKGIVDWDATQPHQKFSTWLFGGGAPCVNIDPRLWNKFKDEYKEFNKAVPKTIDWSYDSVVEWLDEYLRAQKEQDKNR